VDLYSAHR